MAYPRYSEAVQLQIRQRANYLCEYCHASEQWQYVRFTLDHCVPLSSGGSSDISNLALACFHCNRRKWSKVKGADALTSQVVTLFNPRHGRWNEHFIWSVDTLSIIGLTATGRATVDALQLNRERILNIRAADREVNRHPPSGDPIQRN